jgi:hypothetical protein
MARVQYASEIAQLSGSTGKTTYSKTHAYFISKTKSAPGSVHTFTRTVSQANQRVQFGQVSALWKTITNAQRSAWDAFALDITKHNIFGASYTSTGFNLFVQLNVNLLNISQATISDPPDTTTVGQMTSFVMEASSSTPQSWNLQQEGSSGTNPTSYMIYMSSEQSVGRKYCKNAYRYCGYYNDQWSFPFDLFTYYLNVFASIPWRSKVFVKLIPINFYTGVSGITLYNSIILPALPVNVEELAALFTFNF